MSVARPAWIEVGRISRAHGVRGEVRVISDSDNPERFAEGSVLYARPSQVDALGSRNVQRRRLIIDSVRGTGTSPIVAFRETDSREAAESLRGYVLEVAAADLPTLADDEFYPFDLEGLLVRNQDGQVIGRVTQVADCPAHALLSVRLESGEKVLVPFVAAAVPLVAAEKGFVVVDPAFVDGGVGSSEEQPSERSDSYGVSKASSNG